VAEDKWETFWKRKGGLQAGSVIKARTISSATDNRIQLSNSNFARTWASSLGTSWTKIRIACRMSVTDSSANITSTPRFAFGIQSGTSTLFMDSGGPNNWCGINSALASITRSAGPPVVYTGSALYNAAKKIGTTLTQGGNPDGNTITLGFDATTANRIVLGVDITKGSPNYNFVTWSRTNTTSADVTAATFLSQVYLSTPSITNHNFNSGGSINLAVSESGGTFDSVGIAWDHSDALIELSDLVVVKLS
jgi:hypothetical protein